MLVLLIIFMVITPMLSKTVPIDMVKTRNPIKMAEADKEDAILIAVTRDGRVYLSPGNTLISPDQLPSKVKDLQQNRSDKTVYVKADARARFSSVTDVIDELRNAQVDSVGLLTEEIKDKAEGEPLKRSIKERYIWHLQLAAPGEPKQTLTSHH
jgi:biopolymer transport protein ExbD/biopolymer transport protein TolR